MKKQLMVLAFCGLAPAAQSRSTPRRHELPRLQRADCDDAA